MSTLSKFAIYQCDTCDRETEIQLDGNRPDPVRCNITLKCRGKLQKTGERSAKKFLFTPIVEGLEDYIPRGTVATRSVTPTTIRPISIFTGGGDGMIAAAAIRRRVVGSNASFYVITASGDEYHLESQADSVLIPQTVTLTMQVFEITPELLQATKFTYNFKNTAQLIQGPDDSIEGRNLRFDGANRIRVYANGVELTASQFDRSVHDQITLTPAVTGQNNIIEVLVSKDIDFLITATQLIPIYFKALIPTVLDDLALRELNCWGNFQTASIDGVERVLMYSANFGLLDPDKSYGVSRIDVQASAMAEAVSLAPTEFKILLGREPFAVQDKELYAYLAGETLIVEDSILSYNRSTGTGVLELSIDESALTQIYNPILGSNKVTEAINTASITETAQGITPVRRKYILGPS